MDDRHQRAEIKAATGQLNADFTAALRSGLPADGPEAMDIAERARLQIHRRF